MKLLIRIEAPHFTAGVELYGRAAPIINYMRRWSLKDIATYCDRKGWRWEVLTPVVKGAVTG